MVHRAKKDEVDAGKARMIGDRLRLLVERCGGVNAVAAKTGLPASNLYRWFTGASLPSIIALEAIAQACDVDIGELIRADDPRRPPGSQRAMGETLDTLDAFAYVPQLDVQASAGRGAINHDRINYGPDAPLIAFPHNFLRRLGLAAGRVHAIVAVGDSMEPTIRDGDLLLIDRTMATIVDDGIYIMTIGDAVVVKRVQRRRDGTVWLISDNRERYEPEVVPAADVGSLVVEGRVRWFGRTI